MLCWPLLFQRQTGSASTDIVFDVHKDMSIKNAEQQKRSNNVKG